MPEPTIGQVRISRPLQNVLVAYMQNDGYLSNTVAPQVPVQDNSGKYWTWPKGTFLSADARVRAAGAVAAKVGGAPSTGTYNTERIAARTFLPDPIRANADGALQLEPSMTRIIGSHMRNTLEERWVAAFMSSGLWDTTSTGSSWNSSAGDPIGDVITGKRTIRQNTGFEANTMVMGRSVFDDLQQSTGIVDRIKYGQTPGSPALVTEQTLAAVFGVERVVVANAIKNSAAKGQAASYGFIAPTNDAALFYVNPSAGIMEPSAMYNFVWDQGNVTNGVEGVKVYRAEENESDVFEAGFYHDFKIIGSDLGYYWDSAKST